MEMMYEVTLCLSAMCLSINLCVLLVTSAQYFFAISGKFFNFSQINLNTRIHDLIKCISRNLVNNKKIISFTYEHYLSLTNRPSLFKSF